MHNKTEKASNSHMDHQRLTHTSFHEQPPGTQINAERGSHLLSEFSHQDSCGNCTRALILQVHPTHLIDVLHTIPESRLIEAASCLVSYDCTVPAQPYIRWLFLSWLLGLMQLADLLKETFHWEHVTRNWNEVLSAFGHQLFFSTSHSCSWELQGRHCSERVTVNPAFYPCHSKEQGGLEHVERPNVISIEEDKGHSPLTERWNWTFFSGKTRRRDGTRRDTVRKKEESRTWDVGGPGMFVILLERWRVL